MMEGTEDGKLGLILKAGDLASDTLEGLKDLRCAKTGQV